MVMGQCGLHGEKDWRDPAAVHSSMFVYFVLVSFFPLLKLACKKDLINSSDLMEKRSRDVPGAGKGKESRLCTHTGPPFAWLLPAIACQTDVQVPAQMLESPSGYEEQRRTFLLSLLPLF